VKRSTIKNCITIKSGDFGKNGMTTRGFLELFREIYETEAPTRLSTKHDNDVNWVSHMPVRNHVDSVPRH